LVVLTGNFANPIRERKTTENKNNVDHFFMADQFYSVRKHNFPQNKENLHIYKYDAITKKSDEEPFCNYPNIHFKDTEEYIKGTDEYDFDTKIKENELICKKCKRDFYISLSKP
jgi:hypothetical protein